MANYDPKIISKYAEKLCSKASGIVLAYAGGSAILCADLGYIAALIVTLSAGVRGSVGGYDTTTVFAILGLIAGAIGGYSVGTEKAFSLRLQAQMGLCQLKIEENARSRSEA